MGEFGGEYTDNNIASSNELEELIRKRIELSRIEQIDDFLSILKLNNILVSGCNVGNKLLSLQRIET